LIEAGCLVAQFRLQHSGRNSGHQEMVVQASLQAIRARVIRRLAARDQYILGIGKMSAAIWALGKVFYGAGL